MNSVLLPRLKCGLLHMALILLVCPVNALIRANPAAAKAIVVTPAQEVAWGAQASEEFLKSSPLVEDSNAALRVAEVGRRVAKVCDRADQVYRFLVVRGQELQALSFPGGTVCITERLEKLYASDDELAFVLAHELAHIALRHHIAQLRTQEMLRSGAPGDKALLETVKSRMDQDSELEADRFGALYVVRAGYKYTDTYAALGRLVIGPRAPTEDSAHPEIGARIEALRNFRNELERCVEAFVRGVADLRSGQAEGAIAYLELFVAQFPNSLAGRVNLGAAHLARIQQKSGTPAGLAEALPIVAHPGVLVRGSVDRVELGQARDNFEYALRLDPNSAVAQLGTVLIQLRTGKLSAAREQLMLAKSADPSNPEIALCMGNLEFLAENYRTSAELYQQVLSPSSEWPYASYARKNLALAYEKLMKPDEARSLWSSLTDDARIGAEARLHLAALDPESR